ncbi:hypothetical protein KY333_02385 [Candidatus Woesearchaeota archaeon]|nr:hypothetical protein [Candidatus Woesearchaeota archaeon]MBW2994009.1 hypothetical protein [Candidatus Woesearchaeota archaeon]
MKRTLMILGILAAALLIVVACSPKEPVQPAQPVAPSIDSEQQIPAEDTTAEQDVIVVDQEVVEIDDITTDLDLNDLDNLDQELAELDNLEI